MQRRHVAFCNVEWSPVPNAMPTPLGLLMWTSMTTGIQFSANKADGTFWNLWQCDIHLPLLGFFALALHATWKLMFSSTKNFYAENKLCKVFIQIFHIWQWGQSKIVQEKEWKNLCPTICANQNTPTMHTFACFSHPHSEKELEWKLSWLVPCPFHMSVCDLVVWCFLSCFPKPPSQYTPTVIPFNALPSFIVCTWHCSSSPLHHCKHATKIHQITSFVKGKKVSLMDLSDGSNEWW